MVNGVEIDEKKYIFSERKNIQEFEDLIKESDGGSIYWLLGAYGTGKTNILKILRESSFKHMATVGIQASFKFRNTLPKIDFLSHVIEEVTKSIASFLNQKIDVIDIFDLKSAEERRKYSDLLITIDESQDIFHEMGHEAFNDFIRYLVRGRSGIWVICSSSDFSVLVPCLTATELLRSPFLKKVQLALYFSPDELTSLMRQLVSDTLFDDNVELIKEIINYIWDKTRGILLLLLFF